MSVPFYFPICPNIIYPKGCSSPPPGSPSLSPLSGLPTAQSCYNRQCNAVSLGLPLPAGRCAPRSGDAVFLPLRSHPPQAFTFILATDNVFFSRYFPSFCGYVYRSTSLIWKEENPIRHEGSVGCLPWQITELWRAEASCLCQGPSQESKTTHSKHRSPFP